MNNEITENNTLIFYDDEDGNVHIEVVYANEDVWLSQKKMAELFDTTQQNVSSHINNVFKDKELDENSVHKKFLYTANDGKNYNTSYYNLEVNTKNTKRYKTKIMFQILIKK